MSKLTAYGIEIRKLRLDKRLRLADMAQSLGMSVAFLSAIETGRKPIPDGWIGKLSRSLELSVEELATLRRSIDRSRKELRLEGKSEEDKELIAAFARRLDEGLPVETREELKKLFLKSVSGDVPFERRRRGIVVPPASTLVIRGYAEKVRDAFCHPSRFDFPIMDVIEFGIQKFDHNFVFDVQEEDEMDGDEGRVPIGDNRLVLRSDVYRGACSGARRHRFTAAHELGHYLMHRQIKLARSREDGDKIYTDSEWQADTFAGTLLMSPRHAPMFRDASEMSEKCLTSQDAARHMWRKYSDEGIIK